MFDKINSARITNCSKKNLLITLKALPHHHIEILSLEYEYFY